MTTMTKQQKLNTLEAVEARAFAELESADPKGIEFNNILNNVGLLRHITEIVKFGDPDLFQASETGEQPDVEVPTVNNVPAEHPTAYPPEDDVPWETAADEPEKAHAAEEAPALTVKDMRDKMYAYAMRGVDVNVLIQGIGYARLSEVPASQYADLLASAEAAAEGAS